MRQEVYVKFAEALNARRMSQEKVAEAYAAGFCKAAEAMGVDPAKLYKQAGLGQLLGRGLTAVRGIAGHAAGAVRSGAGTAGKAIADAGSAAKHRTMPVLKRYLELLGGGNGLASTAGVEKLRHVLGGLAETGRGAGRNAIDLLNKAYKAHPYITAGTAGAVVGAPLGIALNKNIKRQQRIDELLAEQQV